MRRASGPKSTTAAGALARLALALLTLEALSCNGGGSGGGTIELSYRSSLTQAQQAAFEAARDRLQKVITGGLTAVVVANQTCDDQSATPPTIDQTVNGLLILVNVTDLGQTGIIAQSGPCLVRSKSRLPIVSVMKLNSVSLSALSDESLRKTVLHEMTHALGFGTVWDATARAPLPPLLEAHNFTGAQALAAAKSSNGAPISWTSVPVEDCMTAPAGCGPGTLDSHWRWSVFGDELMTGWITSGAQPFSATTIASLGDLGYSVDLTRADAFTIPSPSAALRALTAEPPPVELGDDVLHVRPVEVDDSSP
ncbi:MAG TPA: leishmanolysin-related zinc metalloendopeptidase [Anaeromyxobacter sp.]|nr:leishmanolysin-related zinc metalloendopeptidase [Anaeromyxobacter sp.]